MTGSVGPDGYVRSAAEERKLNKLMASVFVGAKGDEALGYIRQITIEAVSGPDIGQDQLRHLEGMRYLAAIIQRRVTKGRENE
jgi:hypothetical protein|tara:strand:- start:434 stop:682 length:249 start_codon:yes stop_codon:yes gene_type:complete